jgi:hypothetical protein
MINLPVELSARDEVVFVLRQLQRLVLADRNLYRLLSSLLGGSSYSLLVRYLRNLSEILANCAKTEQNIGELCEILAYFGKLFAKYLQNLALVCNSVRILAELW